MFKKPINRRANGSATPQILHSEQRVHLTWPIRCGRNLPCLIASFDLAWSLARTIRSDVEALRPRSTNRLYYPRRRFRPIEDEE
jgi:hypothetical protein